MTDLPEQKPEVASQDSAAEKRALFAQRQGILNDKKEPPV
jgi:hypothetical protein